MVSFSKGLGLSITDDPIQKISTFRLNQAVRSDSEEVKDDWNNEQHISSGDGEVEESGVSEETRASEDS